MYECKKGIIILNDLPMKKGIGINKEKLCVDRKSMVGMSFNISIYGEIYENITITNYISKKSHSEFEWFYNNKIGYIRCENFLNGKISSIISHFEDKNNKYIDENNVVHIFITNTKGENFEALYSGNYTDEVMKSNWSVVIKKEKIIAVKSYKYNNMKNIFLHNIDLGSWVDHINNNPLDNRIENLRKSNPQENAKNKRSKNKDVITGMYKKEGFYICSYRYDGYSISTKSRTNKYEAEIDGLIAQRHLGYKHNEDMFYLLDDLSDERIKEIEGLLDFKIEKNKLKKLATKRYAYNIECCDNYYKIIKNHDEMLFDLGLDFLNDKMIYKHKNGYWYCSSIINNKRITNRFHRLVLGIYNNEYFEYNIHVDHLNNNPSDNRYNNLFISTSYSNQCNKRGCGYTKRKSGYLVGYMKNYRFWDLIGGLKQPSFKTEQEAINEVNRRRQIIDNARVKLKSKEELDELIKYCLDNGYVQENGLADLDLGYLYWKGVYPHKHIT